MTQKLNKLDEKLIEVDAYHSIMTTIECFSRLSPNIPKQLLEITQHTHGYLNSISSNILLAANVYDVKIKIDYLLKVKNEILIIYNNLTYFVKVHALSIGGVNTIITPLKQTYDQIKMWLTSLQEKLKKGIVTLKP